MKLIRNITIITAIITMTVCLCSCGFTTFDNFKATFIDKAQDKEATVQIGVLEPVTGADSKAAEDEIRGIQLANKVHPNTGGKIVSLVFSDCKSDIDATETAVQTLITKEPMVILGSYASVYSLAASPYIKEAKIPAIAISNTNPLITRNNPYYYRVCYAESNQGDLLARYVLDKKQKKAGVLAPEENDVALAKATAFADRIKAETDNEDAIPFYEYYKTGQKDFAEVLTSLKESGIKYVILPGDYTDAANIITQASQMDLDVQFLGDKSWGTDEFKTALGSGVKNKSMAFVQFFAAEGNVEGEAVTDERTAFLDAYHEEYGEDSEPSENMALGYDAYFVAVDAISKAPKDATSKDIAKILSDPAYSFEGASGSINFNSYGDPIKTAYISKWEKGKIVTIATIEALK